ncbi:MAG: amidohydrolase [Caldilineaceae bacterium SB0670_bin_27]|uniref:Amidohydrolase n=1 Tax=Caldilineaceae bacterium SB0664_bin_27 TaxID=2605260 RepID=A0A6B0YSJ1_9CHLR|nr:amidohydrolase [Caldilineaceae bacterium SB0664_bin_27]MYJ76650.1 amidohydrolase [Caldilineaceae bacterium SB0670_bin_27]
MACPRCARDARSHTGERIVQEWIRREADELLPKLVEWRRDFHRHPELGFQEVRTAGIVAAHLQELGLEVSTGVGKTGVIAMVEPDDLPDDSETVLLRFDMDALPIHEETGLPYASQNAGVMHACGHDGHTAIGMGVAQLLTRHRNELSGRVKLVFQPAEEGLGGAMAMIDDGALEEPQPAAAYGLHLWSRLPYNQVVVQPGPLWAAADIFTLTVHGKGGHGATPHDTIDATLVASQLVVALQTIVSRNANPSDTAVVTVASFQSGNAGNVISEQAVLKGTIRSFEPDVRDLLLRRFEEICTGICQAFGASYEFEMHSCVPATINSEAGARVMEGIAREVVGEQNVAQIAPMMVGEDMAEFLNRAPGCFVLVGAANPEEGFYSPHHSPSFDFEESVMPTGVSLLAEAAFSQLAIGKSAENESGE